MAAEGFEGLCTTLRAVCSSTVFLLSGQSAFVATVGVYDGASGSSLEDVGSGVLTGRRLSTSPVSGLYLTYGGVVPALTSLAFP